MATRGKPVEEAPLPIPTEVQPPLMPAPEQASVFNFIVERLNKAKNDVADMEMKYIQALAEIESLKAQLNGKA